MWWGGVINAEGKSIGRDRRQTNTSKTDSAVKDLIWNPFWFANVTPVGISPNHLMKETEGVRSVTPGEAELRHTNASG